MCLNYIEQIFLNPQDEDWKIGYKCVIQNKSESIYGDVIVEDNIYITSSIRNYLFEIGTINRSSDGFIISNYFTPPEQLPINAYIYPAGFHIWVNKKDALNDKLYSENIIQVKYRQVVAIGKQLTYFGDEELADCVVAKEILIEQGIN